MTHKYILIGLLQIGILNLISSSKLVTPEQPSRAHKFDKIWRHIQKVLEHDGYSGTLEFRHRAKLFHRIESGPFNLTRQNVYLYLEFKFDEPVEVVGWETTGKSRKTDAFNEERPGFVKEYMVQYEHHGVWHTIINPKTKKQFIVSLSNADNAEKPSRIYFPHGLNTTSLQFYPQYWAGAPFLSVDLYYSKRNETTPTNKTEEVKHKDGQRFKSPILPTSKKEESEEHAATFDEVHNIVSGAGPTSAVNVKVSKQPVKDGAVEISEPNSEILKSAPRPLEKSRTTVIHQSVAEGNSDTTALSAKPKTKKISQTDHWQHITDTLKNDGYVGSLQHKENKKLFHILEDPRVQLRGGNRYVYLEFKFDKQVEVIGWETRGTRGEGAPTKDKTGLVSEYIVQYNHDGKWHTIVNPESGSENIRSLSSPSRPERPSRVSFPHGLNTTAIRFYPQQWIGRPYLSVSLFYASRISTITHSAATSENVQKLNSINRGGGMAERLQPAMDMKKAESMFVPKPKQNAPTHSTRTKEPDTIRTDDRNPRSNGPELLDAEGDNSGSDVPSGVSRTSAAEQSIESAVPEEDNPESDTASSLSRTSASKQSTGSDALEGDTFGSNAASDLSGTSETEESIERDVSDGDSSGSDVTPVVSGTSATKEEADTNKEVSQTEPHSSSRKHVVFASTLQNTDGEFEDARCKLTPDWRYENGNHNDKVLYPKRNVDASGAMYGKSDIPFEFPTYTTESGGIAREMTDFIEFVFPTTIRIKQVKVAGVNEEDFGGVVTKFSLLYKTTRGKWIYYSDKNELPRVFDTGERLLEESYIPENFNLPQPIETRDLRIYPHKWTGRPFLSVDFLYCQIKRDCKDKILGVDGLKIQYKQLASENIYRPEETIILSTEHDYLITGLMMAPIEFNTTQTASPPGVATEISVRYLQQQTSSWKSLFNKGTNETIFKYPLRKRPTDVEDYWTTFQTAPVVKTKALRVVAENQNGVNEDIVFNILGCLTK